MKSFGSSASYHRKKDPLQFFGCKPLDIGFSEDGGKCNRAKFVEVYVTDDAGR